MNNQSRRVLSIFSLVMITIGSVDSIRNLPSTALFGSSLIFFFTLAAIFFLLPSALVSAELSSTWSKQGGVYVWVKEAFGTQMGFAAIWFQWIENVFWYPTILSFIAATCAYVINPALASNKYFLVSIILGVFWLLTIVNLFGMRSSSWVANICAVSGLLIPMVLIIGLGTIWYLGKHPVQIHFTRHDILPHLHDSSLWVSLTGIMLSFCGMEIATVHAKDVKEPRKAFPKSLFYAASIIFITLVLGSLSIASVLPQSKISLIAGIMQAFAAFFHSYHLGWMIPVIAILLIFGGLGGVSNWIIAPAKGLLVAGRDGNLPKFLQKENQHFAPSGVLITQAIIVSILALLFLYLPSVNESYWILNAMASQLYMLMYILMFAAGICLRIKAPDIDRPYKIPGGFLGMLIIAGMGIIAAVVTTVVGFFPPKALHIHDVASYEAIIGSTLLLFILVPILCYRFRRKSWKS